MKKSFLVQFFFCSLLITSKGYRFDRRTFLDLGCRGAFTRSNLAQLHGVCEECYELFKEPGIQVTCKSNCFKNDLFSLCTRSLLLHEQEEQFQTMINDMRGISE